jgi:hypothetical protein
LKSRVATAVKSAPTAAIDVDQSEVIYERICDPVGGFRINSSGESATRLRDDLIPQLRDVRDPETNEAIFTEVLTREECFEGPYASLAPEIITIMKPEYGSSDRVSHYSAVVTDRRAMRDPGSHQMNGVFAISGADVAGQSGPVGGWAIEDIAPTVLHSLGLELPSDMDGRAGQEIFAAGSAGARAPSRCEPPGRWPSEGEALGHLSERTDDDEEAVRDRLRALGYFE